MTSIVTGCINITITEQRFFFLKKGSPPVGGEGNGCCNKNDCYVCCKVVFPPTEQSSTLVNFLKTTDQRKYEKAREEPHGESHRGG